MAEDRERFDTLMGQLGIARPKGCLVESVEEAMAKTEELEYPLIVRPSYVLGGRAMQIVYDQAELRQYLKEAVVASHEHPVLIDQYMVGREVEVDAISDGNDVCIPGIMEQIRVKYGMKNPGALLSRGVAGMIGNTLIYTLPGSVKAVHEYMAEIVKTMEHTFCMLYGIDTHGKRK